MTRRFMAILGLLALAFSARAELKLDTLKVGSTVYSNVTVIDVTATDIYFKHSTGVSNTKLRYLEPAVQKRFHYDADIATDAERQRDEESAHYTPSFSSGVSWTRDEAPADVSGAPAAPEEIPKLADSVAETSPLDKPAPPVTVEKWLTDKPVTTDKFVLVFFWKPQSAPCRRAITDLNALQKKFPDNFVIIGITAEAEREVSQMTDPHIEFAFGIDSQATMLHAAGVSTVPSVLLIDPKGIVRYAGHPGALKDETLGKMLVK